MKQQALSQLADGFDFVDIDLCGAPQHRRNTDEETSLQSASSFSAACF
jgi:hypothetical protein